MYTCENFGDITVKCCDNITDKNGETHRYCTLCTNSEHPSNCTLRYLDERANPPGSPPKNIHQPSPPPSNTLQPSSSSTKLTSDNQGKLSNNKNNNNNPSTEHHHSKSKDSDLKTNK